MGNFYSDFQEEAKTGLTPGTNINQKIKLLRLLTENRGKIQVSSNHTHYLISIYAEERNDCFLE